MPDVTLLGLWTMFVCVPLCAVGSENVILKSPSHKSPPTPPLNSEGLHTFVRNCELVANPQFLKGLLVMTLR